MERPSAPELDPAALPAGTVVGPWRVDGWGGRGTYGAVYRAVRVGHEEEGHVALKLAVRPEDPRFEREARLLSQLSHPGVPRLLGYGAWRPPRGAAHPYLVMQWIPGRELYAWAAQRNPSSRQVLRILAQVVRALAAVHAAKGVHRDVKGANVRMRAGDGQVFLMDFGSGNYEGATTLTPQPLLPGTPAYRSPEAWCFMEQFRDEPTARYVATPADDLFALGVMAYRLVTDEYPPSADPSEDKAGVWGEDGEGPRPPAALNVRVALRLNALIMRMLSAKPEERGTAEGMADQLEEAAEELGLEADHPLFAWEALSPASWSAEDLAIAVATQQRVRRRDKQVVRLAEQQDAAVREELARREAEVLARSKAGIEREPARATVSPRWPRFLALAAVVTVLVAGGSLWRTPGHSVEAFTATQTEAALEADGCTTALGDEAGSTVTVVSKPALHMKGIWREMPAKPFDWQRRAPCTQGEYEIRGGCWGKLESKPPNCEAFAYEWRGGCYTPVGAAPPPATSEQP